MKRKILWGLLRLVIVRYIYVPIAYSVLVLIWIYNPYTTLQYFAINWDAYIWLTVLLLLLGYVFLRFSRTKEFGKLFIVSILGVAVLFMYHDFLYDFGPARITGHVIFLGFLFILSAVYFVFPIKWLKPLLFLLPVSALAWFLKVSVYQPLCFGYELYLNNKHMIPPEQFDMIFKLLKQGYPLMFISGSKSIGLLIPYFFALYGSNPRQLYRRLVKRH